MSDGFERSSLSTAVWIKQSFTGIKQIYTDSHSCNHIHGLSCCLLLQFKENRSPFGFPVNAVYLLRAAKRWSHVVAWTLPCWNSSHRAWKSHQSCTLCWFVSSSPPDEANENDSSGSLNNQLSWKQGRQLLRQWVKVFYSIRVLLSKLSAVNECIYLVQYFFV